MFKQRGITKFFHHCHCHYKAQFMIQATSRKTTLKNHYLHNLSNLGMSFKIQPQISLLAYWIFRVIPSVKCQFHQSELLLHHRHECEKEVKGKNAK